MRSRKRRNAPRAGDPISLRIRDRLDELGLSVGELAERLGQTEPQINRLLVGGRSWTLRQLLDTAAALSVLPSQLDPECSDQLHADLKALHLRGDPPQLKVLHVFLQEFPRITAPEDLRALSCVLRSFAERAEPG